MAFSLHRIPQTDDELYAFVGYRFGFTIPRTQVCPDHVAPFTAFADAFFGRNTITPESGIVDLALWHGSRGLSGKSFMLSILAVTLAELLGSDVNLLGGSLAQSMNIHTHVGNALEILTAPKFMVLSETSTEIAYANGAHIHPLTASQKTVRGPHPPRLLLDEIDEMDLKILDAALGQPMPQRNWQGELVQPYTVMCSTWQNSQGTFTEVKKRAEERGIPIYTWCYRESANPVDGWLSQRTIDGKRASIPTNMWLTEYELNEPSGENRAIDSDAVRAAFSLQFAPDPDTGKGGYIKEKQSKDFEEFTFEEPQRHGEYVAGADWGREKDYTVIAVGRVDVQPFRLVYYMRVNRRPYPQMIGWFNAAISKYRASASHDATGLGNVIEDYTDIRARAFTMTGEKRDAMLSEFVSDLENGLWRFPKIPSAYIAHLYAQVGDFYSRREIYHLPDECCAFGLMNHQARIRIPLAAPSVVTKTEGAQTGLERQLDRPSEERRVGDVSLSPDYTPAEFNLTV